MESTFYSRNLEALRGKDPFLHAAVSAAGPCAARLEQTRSGLPTLCVPAGESGGEVVLHSRYDPLREARRLVESALLACDQAVIYLVLGFGLGYPVSALLEKIGADSRILVLEKDIRVFRFALEQADLTELIASPQVFFSVGEPLPLTQFKFKRMINFWHEPLIRVVELAPAVGLDEAYYREAVQAIRDEMMVGIRNIGTLIFLSSLWQYNTLHNLETIIRSPGVDVIEEKKPFAGKPVILVSAGPSLNRNIDALARARGRAVIVSVGTALKALLRHGIRPDVVVAVDGSHKMMGQFQDADLEGIYLVSSSCLYPEIVRLFQGRCFVFGGSNEILSWLSPVIGDKGSLAVGGTVAVSALDLAFRGGAQTVLLVGQDLSYLDDGTTHASGTMYDGQKGDVKQWRKVPGNYAPEVYTDSMFYTYLKLMERLISALPALKVVNCTAGGARILGTELMDLDAALDLYCAQSVAPATVQLKEYQDQFLPPNFDVLALVLEEACEGLKALSGIAGEGVTLCNQLIMASKVYYEDSQPRLESLLQALSDLDRRMLAMEELQSLLAMTIRGVCFGVSTKPRDEEKRMSRAIFANRRSREFYEQIGGAAVWTREVLDALRCKLEEETRNAVAL